MSLTCLYVTREIMSDVQIRVLSCYRLQFCSMNPKLSCKSHGNHKNYVSTNAIICRMQFETQQYKMRGGYLIDWWLLPFFEAINQVSFTYWLQCVSATFHIDKFVALLVNQEFAVDALVALAPQAPDPVRADGTVSSLQPQTNKTQKRAKLKNRTIQPHVQ